MNACKLKTAASASLIFSLLSFNAIAAIPVAARLASVSGPVMVNQGSGFVPFTDKTVLQVGDRVLSLRGARATVLYGNGCAIALKPSSMITVVAKASCKVAGASLVSDTDFTGDQAQVAAAGAGAAGGAGLSSAAVVGLSVAGAAAVGVGAAAATGAIGGSSPAS